MSNKLLLAALFSVAFGNVAVADDGPTTAGAGRRLNSLHTDKAVRHRRLLVKNRFEVSPLFESTINPEFQHIVGGGLKLEYHLSDMLSIGAVGVGSTQFNTKLTDRIVPTLESDTNTATREPSQQEFTDRLNQMPVHGAAFVSITPWYGKLAAFSQAFVAFDFYFQAGVSYAQLTSKWDAPPCTPTSTMTTFCEDPNPGKPRPAAMPGETIPADNNPNNDNPQNDGTRVGLYLGGGIHVFLSDFLALDLSVRDYAFSDNPSGADYNADLFVGKNDATGDDDNRFLHHLFFGAGISIMFPTTVKRTP
ncbi:MAG TPA: outer membrane beta-barrel domain-containing protein [Kofleriaceae bacterium]|nr:outer membrane beta-barrel domain-containing protein [Kofleriaceae bacterium]